MLTQGLTSSTTVIYCFSTSERRHKLRLLKKSNNLTHLMTLAPPLCFNKKKVKKMKLMDLNKCTHLFAPLRNENTSQTEFFYRPS